jgi:hypothetical protein
MEKQEGSSGNSQSVRSPRDDAFFTPPLLHPQQSPNMPHQQSTRDTNRTDDPYRIMIPRYPTPLRITPTGFPPDLFENVGFFLTNFGQLKDRFGNQVLMIANGGTLVKALGELQTLRDAFDCANDIDGVAQITPGALLVNLGRENCLWECGRAMMQVNFTAENPNTPTDTPFEAGHLDKVIAIIEVGGNAIALNRMVPDTGAQSVIVYAHQSIPTAQFYALSESISASATSIVSFCVDAKVAVPIPGMQYLRTGVLLPLDQGVIRQMLLGSQKYNNATIPTTLMKHPLLAMMNGNQQLTGWAQSGEPASDEISKLLLFHGVAQSFDGLHIDGLLGMSYLGRVDFQHSAGSGRIRFAT